MEKSSQESIDNPWTTTTENDAFNKVLQQCERLNDESILLPSNHVNEICKSNSLGNHLQLLQSIYEAKRAVKNAQLSQLRIKLEEDASDVLRSEEIKIKTKQISDLISVLDTVISENQLFDRLSAPLQDNTMKLRSEYHNAAIETFTNIAKCLNQLQSNLDTMDWHDENSFNDATITYTFEQLRKSTKHLKTISKISSTLI